MEFAAEYQGIPDQLQDIVPHDFRREAELFLIENDLIVTPKTAEAVFHALCNRN